MVFGLAESEQLCTPEEVWSFKSFPPINFGFVFIKNNGLDYVDSSAFSILASFETFLYLQQMCCMDSGDFSATFPLAVQV